MGPGFGQYVSLLMHVLMSGFTHSLACALLAGKAKHASIADTAGKNRQPPETPPETSRETPPELPGRAARARRDRIRRAPYQS